MRKSLSELEMVHACIDMVDKLGKEKTLILLRITFEKMSDPKNMDTMGIDSCVFCRTYSFRFCDGCPYNQWEDKDENFNQRGCLFLQDSFEDGFEYSKQRAKDYKFMLEFTKEL